MLEAFPLWYQYSLIGVFGLIMGSFLEVVVTRFHTGASLKGRSRCLSCAKTLTWYELVPIVSYLALRGRCNGCQAQIPRRLFVAEITTALVFMWIFMTFGWTWLLIPLLSFAVTLLIITFYDIRHFIIPDELVLVLLGLAGVIIVVTLWRTPFPYTILVTHLVTATAVSGFYGSLWLVSRGRWLGLGDVKLAWPLGVLLTPLGAFSFVIFSFWLGALISVSIMLCQWLLSRGKNTLPNSRRTLTMKSEVPFAPFIIAAFFLVYVGGVDVLSFMQQLFYVFA